MFFSRLMILGIALLVSSLSNATTHSLLTTKPTLDVEKFNAMPATCITLRQGRKCFATVTISLKVNTVGDYCVYRQQEAKPMRCWKNGRPNRLSFPFESATNVVYELRDQQSGQIIAQTAVEVSWVHKKTNRKRRWRIF